MEEIAKRIPVNRQSALVTSKGESYKASKQILQIESDVPMPLKKIPRGTKDLTGKRFGRLTVIGLSREHKSKWVCRCDCSVFVLRKSKAIRNPRNDRDRCQLCCHYAYQKRTDSFRRFGYDKLDKWEE